MGLDARRGAGFPPELYEEHTARRKNQGPTKQTGPFRMPQEKASEKWQ